MIQIVFLSYIKKFTPIYNNKILETMTKTLFKNFVLQYINKYENKEELNSNNFNPKYQSIFTNKISIGNKRKVNIHYFNNIEF